jgi:thioredoxin-related protein
MKSRSSFSSGLMIILLLIVLIIIAVFASGYYKRLERFTNGGKDYTLHYYCMPSCRYCEQFEKDVWINLVKEVNNPLNKYNFDTVKYDITVGDGITKSELYNINSTPTILLMENDSDRYALYNGERTKAAIIAFAKENSLTEKS